MSSLLVTVDALRASHLAQYGYHRDTFPVLSDLVADGGVHFTQAFANGTNTGVSLPAMLTSRYVGDRALAAGPTVASALPDDVATGAVHSNTYFGSKAPSVEGFDSFFDFGVSATDESDQGPLYKRAFRRSMDYVRPVVTRLGVRELAERVQERVFPASLIHEFTVYENAERTTDRALSWVDTVDGDFFLWAHYMDPHRPYGIDLDDPAYADPADESEIRELMATAGISPDRVTDAQHRRIVDLYDSDVRYTSAHLSRLFDGLRERDLWEDLSVILTADHGEEFRDHGYYYHRNRPYDELLHVPLAVRAGAGEGGGALSLGDDATERAVDETRELLDIAPTVCAFHGVDPPDEFEGRPLFDGGPRRVFATGSFVDEGRVVGARYDGWKYIAHADAEELYDLTSDPGEGRNVAADHPDRCAAYRESVPARLFDEAAGGVPDRADVDGDVERRLEELGYLD